MRATFSPERTNQETSTGPSQPTPFFNQEDEYTKIGKPQKPQLAVKREDYEGRSSSRKRNYESQLQAKYISTDGKNHSVISEEDQIYSSQSNLEQSAQGRNQRDSMYNTYTQQSRSKQQSAKPATPKNPMATLPATRPRIESGRSQRSDKIKNVYASKTSNRVTPRVNSVSHASSEEIVFFSAGIHSRFSDADHDQTPRGNDQETIEEQENEAYVSILNQQRINTGGTPQEGISDQSPPDENHKVQQTVVTKKSEHSVTDFSANNEFYTDVDGGGDTGGQKFPVKREELAIRNNQKSQTGTAMQDYSFANDEPGNQNSRQSQMSPMLDMESMMESEQLYYNNRAVSFTRGADASSGGTVAQRQVNLAIRHLQHKQQYQRLQNSMIDQEAQESRRQPVTPELRVQQQPSFKGRSNASHRPATSMTAQANSPPGSQSNVPHSGFTNTDLRQQLYYICCQLGKKQTSSLRISELIQTIKRGNQQQSGLHQAQAPPRPSSSMKVPSSQTAMGNTIFTMSIGGSATQQQIIPSFEQILTAATANSATTIVDPSEDRTVITQTEIRKLAMCALCLIMMVPRERLLQFPVEFQRNVCRYRDSFDMMPDTGKVQLNGFPLRVKQMIKQDITVLKRLQNETYLIDTEKQIWCFPQFSSVFASFPSQSLLPLSPELGSYQDLVNSLPDPINFCVGIVNPSLGHRASVSNVSRSQQKQSNINSRHQSKSTEHPYDNYYNPLSSDTEREANLSVIERSMEEDESQSEDAKNNFKEFTDIDIHAPASSGIQSYIQRVPSSGRHTKSPILTNNFAKVKSPIHTKPGSRSQYSQSTIVSGSKAARKMLSMTQQVVTGQAPHPSLKIDNQSHVSKKANQTSYFQAFAGELTERTMKARTILDMSEVVNSAKRAIYSIPNSSRKEKVSSSKKSSANNTDKKPRHNFNMAMQHMMNHKTSNRKNTNDSLSLTQNTANSNFSAIVHKYSMPATVKANNHTLSKYRSPNGFGSNRSRQGSAAKTAEINMIKMLGKKHSNMSVSPSDIKQMTPFYMTQGYLHNGSQDGNVTPRTFNSGVYSTELGLMATANSPQPTSHVVSPRSSQQEKTTPQKTQIKTVTGSKVQVQSRPKTSLESRLMNCVSPTNRNEQNTSKERQATKATLAQIMSLNTRRKSNRQNTQRIVKREFAQTMVIPTKSSRPIAKPDQHSSRLLGKRKSHQIQIQDGTKSQGTRLGQLIGANSTKNSSRVEHGNKPYPSNYDKMNKTLALDALLHDKKQGSQLFIYSQKNHRKNLSCQGSPTAFSGQAKLASRAQVLNQEDASQRSSGSVGSDRSRAQPLPQVHSRTLKKSIQNLNFKGLTPVSRDFQQIRKMSNPGHHETANSTKAVQYEKTATLGTAASSIQTNVPKITMPKKNKQNMAEMSMIQKVQLYKMSSGAKSGSKTTREESNGHFRSGSFFHKSEIENESSDSHLRLMQQNSLNKPQVNRSVVQPVSTVDGGAGNRPATVAKTQIRI